MNQEKNNQGLSDEEKSSWILKPLDAESQKKKEDCLACRLTGSAGLFLISVYVLSNVRAQKTQTSRRVVSLVGAGRSTTMV